MINSLNIFTDGGARGNPGPAAIGVFIEDENGKEIAKIGKRIGVATNNVAEYKAVIEALDFLIRNKEKFSENIKLNFFLDSELVCSQLNGIYKVKNPGLKNLFIEIREKEHELQLPIIYKHVRREKNKQADKLVNQALDNKLIR